MHLIQAFCNGVMGVVFQFMIILASNLFLFDKMIKGFVDEWGFVLSGLAVYFLYFVILSMWPLIFKVSPSSSSNPMPSGTVTISYTLYDFLAKSEAARRQNSDEIVKLKMKLSISETKCKLLMIEKQELQSRQSSPSPMAKSNPLKDRVANSAAKSANEKSIMFFGTRSSASTKVINQEDVDATVFAFDDDYVKQNTLNARGHISFDDLTGSDSGSEDAPREGALSQIVSALNPLTYFASPVKQKSDSISQSPSRVSVH